jgi:diacylglycerol kinase (ATP)
MPGIRDALLIVNPGARQVAAQPELPALVREALGREGIETDLLLTAHPQEATDLARRGARQGYDAVLVAGGDGTINEVINGIAGTEVPLGVIPLGTGNVLGGYMGLRAGEWEAACQLIAAGEPRQVDLGVLNERYFVCMAGIGLDALICSATDSQWKQWLGKLAFVAQCMESMALTRPWQSEICIDGQSLDGDVWGVFACNTPEYTWRIRLVPEARDDDGLLDFVVLRGCRPDELQRIVAALFVWGESAAGRSYMQVVRGRELQVRTATAAPWQVDGEVGGNTPVTCRVAHGALRVITPAGGR